MPTTITYLATADVSTGTWNTVPIFSKVNGSSTPTGTPGGPGVVVVLDPSGDDEGVVMATVNGALTGSAFSGVAWGYMADDNASIGAGQGPYLGFGFNGLGNANIKYLFDQNPGGDFTNPAWWSCSFDSTDLENYNGATPVTSITANTIQLIFGGSNFDFAAPGETITCGAYLLQLTYTPSGGGGIPVYRGVKGRSPRASRGILE